ncbi:hypothetical protein V1498_02850 [Peribacillus sp. SCS-26]|uniref:hypothetical protein n=1 Tax=Paraperibacillus marinus TaxID=3115295 RepID=UPI00390664BE
MSVFRTDSAHKAFIITLGGFAGSDKASNFVENLKSEVSKIDVKNYTLIVNSSELRTFKPEILPVLETSYGLYMSLGFKRVLMVKPQRVTPRLQLRRIAKKVHFTGEFIDDLQSGLLMSGG